MSREVWYIENSYTAPYTVAAWQNEICLLTALQKRSYSTEA